MKKLITNSDDFGLTQSITDAIIDTHLNGIMTSTTLMANMEGAAYAIQKAKEITTLGVGIHFNLTEGKPLTEPNKIPLLLNQNGNFKNNAEQRKNFLFGKEKQRQVELELTTQLEYLLDNGLTPTHFDSHHHITGTPVAFWASVNAAKKYNINKARITNIDFQYAEEYCGGELDKIKRKIISLPKSLIHQSNKTKLRTHNFKTPEIKILPNKVLPVGADPITQLLRALSVLNKGVTEISFHPGYVNSYPEDSEKTAALRIRDLKVANSNEVIEYIKKHKIQLISFNNL